MLIIDHTCWRTLNTKIRLQSLFFRKILIEKISIEYEMMSLFISVFNNCEIFYNTAYRDSFFFLKKINYDWAIIASHENKHGNFYFRKDFWEVFLYDFKMTNEEIEEFTRYMLNDVLDLPNLVKPCTQYVTRTHRLDSLTYIDKPTIVLFEKTLEH